MSVPLLDVLARVRRRSLPLLLLCAALLPLLVAAEALGWRAAFGPPSTTAAADTTVLFGPRQFNATSAGALYVEQFSTTVDHAATYVLEVTNGAASGSNRVVNGAVKLNGTTVVSASDLQNEGRVITRAVWPADGTNTVQVEAKGNSALYMNVRLLRIIPQARPLYRHGWRKTTAAYQVFHDSFNTPRGVSMPGRLYVEQGSGADSVFLNGQRIYPSCVPDLNNSCITSVDPYYVVSLQAVNAVRVEMGGPVGSAVVVRVEAVDTMAPVIAVTAPAQQLITKENTVTVAGTVTDDSPPVTLTIDGDTVPVDGTTGAFSHPVALAHDGTHTIQLVARDGATPADGGIVEELDPEGGTGPQGNVAELVRTVIRDSQAPALALSAPADGAVVDAATILVQGTVTDATALTVNVNGVPVTPDAAGAFALEVALTEGANFVTASATDAAGNVSTVTRQVTRSAPPALAVSAPVDGSVTQAASVNVQGTATGAAPLSLTLNGSPVAIGADGAFSQSVPLSVGANTLTLVLTDGVGRTATATRSVTREASGPPPPPDPATVAPVLNLTVPTTQHAATEFLYTGPNPIQTGVAPGTINPIRSSVLRGRVLDRDGQPLPNATVTVAGHPELGQTRSRADGMYDLAVNGGGALTVSIEKAGYLPAQRQVREVPWQDFAQVDDAALVALDAAVTSVSLSPTAGVQVARGTPVADEDGPRRATVIFSAGTEAVLEMPDGSTVPAGTLSIRATEYTVGEGGLRAMPAPLPPTSGYTYAVELSADEAVAAGAAHVRFSKPVSFYVENFLEFPVGIRVPVGVYERGKGAWVPVPDGRVIAILSTEGGVAAIDVNGDGQAEGEAALAQLGIDTPERERLATLYTAGQTLWRVELTHFSTIDCNWPAGPDPAPPPPPPLDPTDPDDPCNQRAGSIIECETRVLGERLGLTGTGLALNYRSNRVAGRHSELVIPLTGDSIAGILRVELEVQVAGRVFRSSYAPERFLKTTFVWDGKDAYGREVQGAQPVQVRRGYVYRQFYNIPPEVGASFGLTCRPLTSYTAQCIIPTWANVSAREEGTDWEWSTSTLEGSLTLPRWDARAQGFGAWTLSAHHVYDARAATLHLGTGESRSASLANGRYMAPVVGNRTYGYGGEGGDARTAPLGNLHHMEIAADGSLLLTEGGTDRVRRVAPDGTIRTVAGSGTRCTNWSVRACGDGGPATQADLWLPADVAEGPDGSLYIADYNTHRIRKVGADGIISTIAGSGTALGGSGGGFGGDGGPATQAQLGGPLSVAVAPDGTVYFVDSWNARVRRIGTDGIIHTVAGSAPACWQRPDPTCGDGGPATAAGFNDLTALALGPDGSLYLVEDFGNRIRRVSPNGIVTKVAGTGQPCQLWLGGCGDGGPAIQARISYPWDVDVGPDGSVYIVERDYNSAVRRVSPDGIITTIAGEGNRCYDWNTGQNIPSCGGPGLSRQVKMEWPVTVQVGPDGSVYVGDVANYAVYRVGLPLPGFTDDEVLIASEDAGQLFHFDRAGRHLRTTDPVTGRALLTFAYDAAGRVTGITHEHGQVTQVERGPDGAALAVVGPYGDRTEFAYDGDGYLSRAENGAGEAVELGYAPQSGLLSTLTDPLGRVHRYTYAGVGSPLSRDEDPAGGWQSLSGWTKCTSGLSSPDCVRGQGVRLTTAEGRVTSFWTGRQRDAVRREVTGPNGLMTVSTGDSRGVVDILAPDGTRTSFVTGVEPRFGMQVPFARQMTVTLPSGLASTTLRSRAVTLSDPDNPFTLLTQTDSVSVNGRVTVTAYDAAARRVVTTSPAGRQVENRLDSLGRVVEARVPGTLPVRYTWDSQGRLETVAHGDRTWTQSYGTSGRLAVGTDPLGGTLTFGYDSVGRVVRKTQPGVAQLNYRYDAAGNLAGISRPGAPEHLFAYDGANRARWYTPAGADTAAGATRYTYNRDGELTRVDRPGGRWVQVGRDGAGRVSTVTTADGAIQMEYLPTGRLGAVTGPDGVRTAMTYDGSLPLTATVSGPVAGTVTLGWGTDLRPSSETVGGTAAVALAYDADGVLTAAGALTLQRDGASGRLTGTTLAGVTTSVGYDSMGSPASMTATAGSTTLMSTTFVRDRAGRITGLSETSGGETVVWGYGYDSAGHLAQVLRNGQAYAAYEYDGTGNALRTITPAGVVTGSYDAQDRLLQLGDASYGYNGSGQLAFRAVGTDTTTYTYDVLGNLRGVRLAGGAQVGYLVDGFNRRVVRTVDGARTHAFLYGAGSAPVAELDAQNQVVTRFVYGTRSYVPDYMVRGGRTFRLVHDHLGSVRRVVDAATGEVVQALDYGPRGEVLRDTDPGFQPFGYGGGLYDPLTGLVRMGARDYDARTGRWTAKDPSGFAGRDFNLYAYTHGDYVNLVDPSGQIPILGALALAWAAAELGLSIADLLDFLNTLTDECASGMDKLMSGGMFMGGMVSPGNMGQLDELADLAKRIPDDALVCRGGQCFAKDFVNGTDVWIDDAGKLQNVSVNSAPGASVEELSQGIRNGQVGVSTAGEIRAAGGDVIPSPTSRNPNHCTMCGITPEQAQTLFQPTIKNPAKP